MVEMEFYRGEHKYYYETEIRNDTVAGHPVRMTCYHTVISSNWDTSYVLMVQDSERIIGREICGSRLDDGNPCTRIPLQIDEEPYPTEIGRCILHRPSQHKQSQQADITVSKNVTEVTPKLPVAMTKMTKKIMSIADEQFMNCSVCHKRDVCN